MEIKEFVFRQKEKIMVYEVAHKRLGSKIIYNNPEDVIEEIKSHLEEGTSGDRLYVAVYEMEKKNYESLPEFSGW